MINELAHRKRGRPPKIPLFNQVEEALANLHQLDELHKSPLRNLPEVSRRANYRQTMPEAQALRRGLIEAAMLVASDISSIPGMEGVKHFLEGYFSQCKKVSEIANEMGVTRQAVYRNYRKRAFRYTTEKFVLLISLDQ